MAMTIDDDIEMLEYIHGDYRRGCRITVALEHTINNLRKYQKIEQIAREGKNETRCEEIVRVIDGKA